MSRTTYSAKFKSDKVIEVLHGEDELGAIAARHNISLNMLRRWKQELLDMAPQLF
jgi:transposase-like protein